MTAVNRIMEDAQSIIKDMQRMASAAKGTKAVDVQANQKNQFAEILTQAMGQVDQLETTSKNLHNEYVAKDQNQSLAQVMLESQKVTSELQSVVQIHNQAIQAYKEIENMQV